MTGDVRQAVYLRHRAQLTPRQRRRLRHKMHRALRPAG
jgi:hypothetical protein